MVKDLSNLTKAQVEALLECFDFLKNGYQEQSCFEIGDLWVIQLKNGRTHKVIRVFVRPNSYALMSRGHARKKVLFASSSIRYRILVNSDASVGVIKLSSSSGQT